MKKPQKRKRASEIMKKAWATRRRNAKAKSVQGMTEEALKQELNQAMFGDNSPNTKPRSDVDAIAATIEMHRNDMLCDFLGDMVAGRSRNGLNHMPIVVTRAQAEAIEEFLTEHGFSPFGRRNVGLGKVA